MLWMSPEELISPTLDLIVSPERRFRLARAATQGGERFATERFRQRVREVFLSLWENVMDVGRAQRYERSGGSQKGERSS